MLFLKFRLICTVPLSISQLLDKCGCDIFLVYKPTVAFVMITGMLTRKSVRFRDIKCVLAMVLMFCPVKSDFCETTTTVYRCVRTLFSFNIETVVCVIRETVVCVKKSVIRENVYVCVTWNCT